jgi:hypothetical protein
MGLIKESDSFDFIIQSPPLTKEKKAEKSEIIRTRRLQNKAKVKQPKSKKRIRPTVLKIPND